MGSLLGSPFPPTSKLVTLGTPMIQALTRLTGVKQGGVPVTLLSMSPLEAQIKLREQHLDRLTKVFRQLKNVGSNTCHRERGEH